MDALENTMKCRDTMEKLDYPIEMLRNITQGIDEVITKGMKKRDNKINRRY